MKYMFDGAPPDQAHLQMLWQAGYRVAGVYVGGPNLYLPDLWHSSDISAARLLGFSIVAFYVGYDGNHLQAATGAGLHPGDIYCLDVEGGAPATVAQQTQFSHDVRVGGYRSALYGLVSTTNANWSNFDAIIAANYTGQSTPPATNVAPGSVAQVPQGWQWRGTFTDPFSGATIDATTVDDYFVGGTPEMGQMTLDVARSIVFVRLSGEGLLQSQAQVDAYAGPMAQPGVNPEAKLTDLNNDINANPSSLTNRVKKLEAAAGTPPPDDDSTLDARVTALETFRANVKAG